MWSYLPLGRLRQTAMPSTWTATDRARAATVRMLGLAAKDALEAGHAKDADDALDRILEAQAIWAAQDADSESADEAA